METMSNLPHYEHRIRVWLEGVEGLSETEQLQHLLVALFQWMRVGTIQRLHDGPALGHMALEFDLVTTCPPHDLGQVEVLFKVSQSKRLEENPQ